MPLTDVPRTLVFLALLKPLAKLGHVLVPKRHGLCEAVFTHTLGVGVRSTTLLSSLPALSLPAVSLPNLSKGPW